VTVAVDAETVLCIQTYGALVVGVDSKRDLGQPRPPPSVFRVLQQLASQSPALELGSTPRCARKYSSGSDSAMACSGYDLAIMRTAVSTPAAPMNCNTVLGSRAFIVRDG